MSRSCGAGTQGQGFPHPLMTWGHAPQLRPVSTGTNSLVSNQTMDSNVGKGRNPLNMAVYFLFVISEKMAKGKMDKIGKIYKKRYNNHKSHQPSGLRWFSALYWSHPLPLFPRGGVYPSPYPLPRTQNPLPRAGLEILIATFLAISLLFFFVSFSDAFLGRSWLRFPSQLASQNRPESEKNRS